MSVVTRFAPSPTGFLHIGGARTALFNWLFAQATGGQYLLRIEDTDRARSTKEAIDAIVDGLDWLGLKPEGEPVFQYARAPRHREAAEEMIKRRTAFRCYMTPEELEAIRLAVTTRRSRLTTLRQLIAQQRTSDRPSFADLEVALDQDNVLWDEYQDKTWEELQSEEAHLSQIEQREGGGFRSPYRDGGTTPLPDAPYVVRLRAPDTDVVNDDLIQGPVRIQGRDIDDLVLLRADGNPTYMLSVVVDDHDMGVTHVIRGDDHLTNAARQIPIFQAMGWTPPKFAHVSLIHGEDGKKLSKRHGAQAVHEYRDMGYLPEAMNAYLMRLGWSPGHDDIITKEEAAKVFKLEQIGKAPARLDFVKLDNVNAHFMKLADDARLTAIVLDFIASQRKDWVLSETSRARIAAAMPVLKKRAKHIAELADLCKFLIVERPLTPDDAAKKHLNPQMKERLQRLKDRLSATPDWENTALAAALKAFATDEGVGMGQIGPGLRAALTGGAPAPDLGQTLEALGREESLARIADQT